MDKTKITAIRECVLSVGDVINHHNQDALVREITPNYVLLQINGTERHISMEQMAIEMGYLFTLKIKVEET